MARTNPVSFPEPGIECFGRGFSAACSHGVLWAATRYEAGAREGIILLRQDARTRALTRLELDAHGHQPFVTPTADGAVAVSWNEVTSAGRWRIRLATVRDLAPDIEWEGPATVFESDRACLPPVATCCEGRLWLAWATVEDQRSSIRLAEQQADGWQLHGPVSADADAFRPWLAADEHGLLVAWDEYREARYSVAVGRWHNGEFSRMQEFGQPDERWFCPKLATDGEKAYLTWVVLREVHDDLGIAEHVPFGMLAELRADRVRLVTDAANPDEPRMAADFREGLLASEAYMGYHGLRRNPWIAISEAGAAWLLWEVRVEATRKHLEGRLVGRRMLPDGTLTPTATVHEGGCSYAVAPRFVDKRLPVAFYDDARDGSEVIQAEFLELDAVQPYTLDAKQWARWQPGLVACDQRPRKTVAVDQQQYHLFWADTHCHSVFSPDAEGEVDELIHFGRDIAGLDAICVVDNDYYPHKALSEAEWRTHEELCRHFTREGEFVAFPGWEYTYHRPDLEPTFNHRSVLYPRPGGALYRRIDPAASRDHKLFESLRGSDAMCYPHHCTYEIIDRALDWNVEVVSSWRVCMEETDFTMRQLQSGQKFGFIGSSDSHRSVPGLGGALTGIYAEALTPEALFDAYRQRRTFATQGTMLFIDFRVAGLFMGCEGVCSQAPDISARIEAPMEIERVEVLRDGEVVHRVRPQAPDCELECRDHGAGPGEHFYFLRVKLNGDPSFNMLPGQSLQAHTSDSRFPHNLARARGIFSWTSPIWVSLL